MSSSNSSSRISKPTKTSTSFDSQESQYSNRSDGRQTTLNLKNPTTGRVLKPVVLSEDSESNSECNNSVTSDDVEDVTHLHVGFVNKAFLKKLLLSFVKHVKLSKGVDFLRVMCYEKKKNRMSEEEKQYEKKMVLLKKVISTMTLQACRIDVLEKYLLMPKIHLDTLPGYMGITAIVVEVITEVLMNTCGYRNVDPGDIRDYFHGRFTNERNQKNYHRKPKPETKEDLKVNDIQAADAISVTTSTSSASNQNVITASSKKRAPASVSVQAKKKHNKPSVKAKNNDDCSDSSNGYHTGQEENDGDNNSVHSTSSSSTSSNDDSPIILQNARKVMRKTLTAHGNTKDPKHSSAAKSKVTNLPSAAIGIPKNWRRQKQLLNPDEGDDEDQNNAPRIVPKKQQLRDLDEGEEEHEEEQNNASSIDYKKVNDVISMYIRCIFYVYSM